MTRFIMPVILIGVGIAVFLVFTNPIYNDISELRGTLSSFDEALNNSKTLERERDKLAAKYNSINPSDIEKLQKLLPGHVDNIRLILEIGEIAAPYNMVLGNVKYNAIESDTSGDTTVKVGIQRGSTRSGIIETETLNKDYSVWNLEFSITGSYNDFLNFTRDLESNLRIVDVSSIAFSSGTDTREDASVIEKYNYDFKIKTYWLKN